MVFEKWSRDGLPLVVEDLDEPDAIGKLARWYCGDKFRVMLELLNQAYRLGARSVVIEPRYVDADYRNEHSRFYSTTFRPYPSVAHRLHFFTDKVTLAVTPTLYEFRKYASGYLGYAVMRPLQAAAVGRTVLRAPTTVPDHAIVCRATDRVNLVGTELSVVGVPFYAQDAQLSRCGQASLLATAYYHHVVLGQRRVLPGEIADAVATASSGLGRPVPSPGMDAPQLVAAASAIGLPPVVYDINELSKVGLDLERVLCWYLNSRFPVTIATHSHAFLIVGYDRRDNPDGSQDIRFLRQDDEGGPYQWVEHWRLDQDYGPWRQAIVPLPQKVYLRGENAEAAGRDRIRSVLESSSDAGDRDLLARLDDPDRPLSWRSALVPSTYYKRAIGGLGLPTPVAVQYQLAPMSRYVWVVELTDRDLRDDRKPCVVADVIIDATDHERDVQPLAWRVPSGVGAQVPDMDKRRWEAGLRSDAPSRSIIEQYTPHVRQTP